MLASLVVAALLGLPDLAHADPPGRVWLFAFVDGQTRIDLQWSRNRNADPPVQDHKIEACKETADNDCRDADDTDWATLVAAHPQETSTRHSNKYTHTGLSEGETWHYRVWSRNDDGYVTADDRGEATATTASMPMHMDESDNPTCDGARWKAYMTVGTFGAYNDQGYRNYGDGALDNQSFMLGDTNYTVTQIYYDHERTNYPTRQGRWYFPASYHFAVTEYPFDPGKLEDLTLYVGDMMLPLSSYGSHSTQGFGEAYRWGWSNRRWTDGMEQSPYDNTFDYRDGDKVMVCLTDTAPVVTLVLTPDSISESGSSNSSTVTATLEQAVDSEFTVTVSAEAVSPVVAGDFTLSTNKVLTFPANTTTSTGTVTITAVNNNVDAPDKTVTVAGELSSGAGAAAPSPVELTIRDDDSEPTLNITVDPVTIAETGGTSTIKVSASGSTFAQSQTFTLTLGGQATETDDYTVSAKSLTLGATQTEVTATVTAVGDSVHEGDETIIVTAHHGANQVGTAQTITITDDDLPVLSIADATAVTEGEAAQFVVTLTPASGQQVTVNYSTADGTAKASEDYTAASDATLTFAPDETTKTISVATTQDTKNEATEAFTVTLSAPSNATLKSDAKTATGTINDDHDALPVLSIADATAVTEGEAAQFVVTLTPASGQQVTVNYSTADGTAKASEDYTAASDATLTFAPDETTKTISVATTQDTKNEATEAFTVTLSAPSNATLKSDAKTATGTINDDHDALPVLSITDATAVTEGEAAQFVVTLTPVSGQHVTVNYSTADGTAKASEDYTAASDATLTFAPDETTKTISVATTEDTRNEATEAFTVTLSVPSNATLKSDAKTATGTINDDDDTLPVLSIEDATAVEEGQAASFVVTLAPASGQQVTVRYSTADGTAKASEDYTAASDATLTFAPDETTKTISVATTEDTRNEATEAFTVTLSVPSNATLKSDAKTATGTINDDDDTLPVLSIEDATAVDEGQAASFVVTLAPASGRQVTVRYSTADGTAKASEDYTAASDATLTFAPDETTKTISVATTEDTRNEATEAFTVTLSVPSNATLKSDAKTATGTINDDDDTLPVLSIEDATAVEEGQAASFVVTLAPASGQQVTVRYSTADGTAKASEDYTAASDATLTFAPDETTKTISVATTEDTRNEATEAFTVTLSAPSNATLKSDAKTATGTINDDDDTLPVLSIEDATAVDEGQAASFVVTLAPASGQQVTVRYSTADGTAKASENDYTSVSGATLTFAADEATKMARVWSREDTRNEGEETFTVTLSGETNATLKADAETATGRITDGDPLTAAVTAKAQNVREGQPAEFEVTITGGTSTADVVVSYSVGGEATSADYDDPGAGSLTITSGAASGTITIATTSDDVVEPNETLEVTLDSATSAGTVTVTDATATTTILQNGSVTVSVKAVVVENDPNTPDDEYEDKSIAEEGESAEFAVELSGAVSSAVQVTYATENGTAESGTGKDYTARAATTLTFSPNAALRQTLTVATLDDTLNEATETFAVKLTALSLPDGVALGQASATGRITDDDPLTATVTAKAESVDEGQTATFTVSLTGGTSTAPVVVHYSLGGSATSGDDYTAPVSRTLTIGSGTSSGTFTIETLTDNVVPETETLEVTLDSATSAGTVMVSPTAATTAINNTTRPTLILEDDGSSSVRARRSVRGASIRGSSSSISCDVCMTEGDTQTGTTRTVRPMLVLPGTTQKVIIPASQTVTIDYETSDGTAQAGQDYVEKDGTLTFTGDPNDGFKAKLQTPITLQTIGDTLNEPDRTFTLTLLSATLPDLTTTDAVSFTVAVRDDDPISAEVEALSSRVNEGQSAAFQVNLSGGTPTADVVISYAVGGSATAGDDYTAPPGTLTIASDRTSGTITIETLDDGVREDNDETMVVTLTGATTAGTATVASQGATTTISGEGPPARVQPPVQVQPATARVSVSAGAPSVNEGETATFEVTVSGGTGTEMRISYSVGGTATPGADYTAPSGTLTIGSGASSGTIAIATLADDVLDPDETLVVELDGASAGSGVTVTLDVTQATTTIVDGAGGADGTSSGGVTVSVAPATVTEGDDASFAVDLSGKVAAPVTVSWSAASGPGDTAEAGTDYTAARGTLTFVPGETRKAVRVSTVQDDLDEVDETFTVTLAGPNLPAGVTLGTGRATGTILDDDVTPPTATLTSADTFPAVGTFSVTITFSEAVTGFALEDIQVTNGTAANLAGADPVYSVDVTPDEDFAGDVTVAIPADAVIDAQGHGNVGASADFAADTTPPVVEVEVEVAWGAAAYTATEGGAAAEVTVSLSDDPRRTVVIPLTARNGNGASDADYTGVPAQVTFAGGRTAYTFTVTAVGDVDEDAGETVTLGFGELPAAVSAGSPATATITLAGESAATRYARVMRTLLPEAATAMTDATVGAIGDRLDDAVHRGGTAGSLSLAGVEMLAPIAAREGSADSVYWTSRDQIRSMSSAQLIRGSSFMMTLEDPARLAGAPGPGPNAGSAAVWGAGDYRNLRGREDLLAWRGSMVSLHLGADLVALPNLVAGLALSRSVVGFDYTDRTNPRTVTGTFETDLIGVHPYASWTPSAALGLWATGGLGWGGVGIDDNLDPLQTSTTRLLSGALGGSSRVLSVDELVPGGATALYLKGEGFVTGAWAAENGRIVAQDVGVQKIRLSVEGSHEQRGLWGSVLTPALELGLRHDSGDAAQGAGVELGGELRYVQPELGLTVEGRGRVLATHRSTTEEWGVGGRIQLEFGSDRQGLSLSLAPSLGVAASGTHALWEYGVADRSGLGLSGAGETNASSRLDARADYRLLTMGGLGMLTPYGGLSLAGRDGRDYRAGARLETDTFNLSLEGKRSERGTGPADHGVTVQGAVRF